MPKDDATTPERRHTARLVGLGLLAALLLLFIAQNFRDVQVTFFIKHVRTKVAWGLLVAALIGFVAGWLAGHDRD